MPKVKAKVIKIKTDGGKFQALLLFNRKIPREGEHVTVKWGSERTLPQNAFYWLFLEWLIKDAGLNEQGHFCSQALHDNLKAHFKEESTSQMNKMEFSEYFEKVDQFMQDFFEIDTSPFWEEYREKYEQSKEK